MKNVEAVRQEVVAHVERVVASLASRFSWRFGEDVALLTAIDTGRRPDLVVLLTNTLMRELGDSRPGAKVERYDRTRRLVNKRTKRPRGVTAAQLAAGDVYD